MPAAGGASMCSSEAASRVRAPRATVCHAWSGAAAGAGRGWATNVPRPGRASSTPRRTSMCTARWTVAGPAPCRRISSRTDAIRSPGLAAAAAASSSSRSVVAVLLSVMRFGSNAIAPGGITPGDEATGDGRPPGWAAGLLLGALGTVAFSFSFPATKLALDGFDPWLVAFGRAAIAGLLAAAYLAAVKPPAPTPGQWRRLVIVAGGVIVGFPLFTSLALVTSGSAHGAVVIAVLPAATALAAVARAGERPGPAFWLAAAAGLAVVLAFVLHQASGALTAADAFLLLGTACCALGYAEGGALARELGGARTISWALVLSLPLTIPVTVVAVALTDLQAPADAWLGLSY